MNVLAFSYSTEGDITVPTNRDKYGNTKTNCYCEVCGKFLNLQDLDTQGREKTSF